MPLSSSSDKNIKKLRQSPGCFGLTYVVKERRYKKKKKHVSDSLKDDFFWSFLGQNLSENEMITEIDAKHRRIVKQQLQRKKPNISSLKLLHYGLMITGSWEWQPQNKNRIEKLTRQQYPRFSCDRS